MRINTELTDDAVMIEVGQRLGRARLDAGLTQAQLAREAGISKRTLERVESGAGCEFVTLVRLLRVLKLGDTLNGLVPETSTSPIALAKLQGRQRQRVGAPRRRVATPKESATPRSTADTSTRGTSSPPSGWKWGK